MDISIVILTWNSAEYIPKCLDSIISSLENDDVSYEIFIVDNGSADNSVSLIKDYQESGKAIIRPIFLDENTGTTYSRNLALAQAEGKYVVVMDSDVEVNAETFSGLMVALEKDQNVGMVTPRLLYGSGALQKSTDQFPTLWWKIYRYFFLKKIEEAESRAVLSTTAVKVDYAISAFWMLRKEVLSKVGLLDENIFYAPEDVDFCLRIWKAGFEILYVPSIQATHYAQEISRGFKINKATIEHLKGLLYFFRKHNYFLTKPKFF